MTKKQSSDTHQSSGIRSPVLEHLYDLIDQGFTMIPTYQADDHRVFINGIPTDKEVITAEDTPVAKVALVKWKKYKTEHVTKEQILTWYIRFKGCAWAVLCGKASGDLFVIDFDDPELFESHFMDWLTRTMIVQTPSGGYHAYFRISPCPANSAKYKLLYDIDTRGEGGYVLAPVVSHGYETISKEDEIATITDLDAEIDIWDKLDIEDEYYDLAKIRSEVSVLDMVRHYGDAAHDQPIRDGMKIKCPFHNDSHPSMVVHHKRFKCFGCEVAGSALDYVMLKLHTDDVTLSAKAIEKITNKEFRMTAPAPGQQPVGTTLDLPNILELTGDWNGREMRINIQPQGFISEYMEYAEKLTVAYSEYHYAGALMLLSTMSMRRRHVKFAHKTYHPLLYIFLLGQSTVSMKSMAMDLVRRVIDDTAWGEDTLLPNSFTPEALYELMDKNNQRSLVNDEAGAFLKNMKKPYMRDMQDMLCQIFDEKSMRRKLRTSKDGDPNNFVIDNPFLNILFATVPSTVQDTADATDIESGWFVRFLFAYPRYEKPIDRDIWFRKEDDSDVYDYEQIVGHLKEIDTWLNNSDDRTMGVDDQALDRLRNWRADLDEEIRRRDNELYGTIMGRLSDYVIKISMLHAISRMSDMITLDDLDQSIDVVENFFLHTAEEIFGAVDDASTDFTIKRYTSITSFLKKHRGNATRREIMRKTHLKKKEIDELIDTMLISGEIRAGNRQNKNGTTTTVYYLQQ